jgi:hypothetical protein
MRIGGLHPGPFATFLEHPQGLAGESLGHLLGAPRWIEAKRGELARERMFA